MNIHTPSQNVLVKTSIAPASRSSAITAGTNFAVDTLNYTRALVIFTISAHDRTNGDETLDLAIYESDTQGGTYTAISGASFTQIAAQSIAANTGNVYLMDIDLTKQGVRKRWLSPQSAIGGTSPGPDVYGVVFVLFNPENAPPTQDATVIRA